ncbi:MAG: ABC transporter permease [Deltaproteobacteria bacterium]|nr:ABC transporter permease [Deltaproteobacteria bacterium]
MKRRWLTHYRAVVLKEFRQTLRDRRIMFMLVAAPLIQTILFGFAVDFDVDRVPTAVADLDRSAESRAQARRLLADGTLRERLRVRSATEADRMLDEGRAAAALVLPPGFGADAAAGRTARAQLLVDGTDPVRAGAAGSAAGGAFAVSAAERVAARAGGAAPGGVVLTPRVLYNPRLQTAVYIVPGILAMLLVVVTTIVTAMGLSREREMGTMEQVLVTPIRPFVLLAGKMTPFVVIGLLDVLLALTAMSWIFAVPLRGPFLVLLLGSVLYLCSTLGVGLLVSTVSATQQQSFLGGFLFVLPAALLSGIMTPIRAMPGWLQLATWGNPLRFYAELMRGVLLRGSGFAEMWVQLLVLAAYGTFILSLATARFRTQVG